MESKSQVQPTALQVWEQRQLLQEPAFLRHTFRRPLAHEVRVPDGRAKDDDASFSRRLASPDRVAQLRYVGGWGTCLGGIDPGLDHGARDHNLPLLFFKFFAALGVALVSHFHP